MSKKRWNERGISLVELLAVMALIGIIGILVFGIMTNGQKQYSKQSEKNRDQQNITYVMKVLTKEIRESPGNITINSTNEIKISGVTYKQEGSDLKKDSAVLVNNISKFEVSESQDAIYIKLVSSNGEEVSTQIAKRS